MGGPENVPSTIAQEQVASNAFDAILNNERKGRIAISIAVETKGGVISNKTITIHDSTL